MSLLGAGLALSGVGMLGNILQARSSNKQQAAQYGQQASWQEKLAREGIQMRVADAKKAGIHPLAAIGAQGAYSSPVSVGGKQLADMSTFGQDLTRAGLAQGTSAERKMTDIQLDSANLDNEMKRLELASMRRRLAGQMGPPMPDMVNVQPAKTTSHDRKSRSMEASSIPTVGWGHNADGSITPIPSELGKERQEDDFILQSQWKLENYLGPNFNPQKYKPPRKHWPKGAKDMEWKPFKFKWVPVYKGKARSFGTQIKDKARKTFGDKSKIYDPLRDFKGKK